MKFFFLFCVCSPEQLSEQKIKRVFYPLHLTEALTFHYSSYEKKSRVSSDFHQPLPLSLMRSVCACVMVKLSGVGDVNDQDEGASIARLGGFPPNWVCFYLIGRKKCFLGRLCFNLGYFLYHLGGFHQENVRL